MNNARQQAIEAYEDAISYLNECTANLSASLVKKNLLLNKQGPNKKTSSWSLYGPMVLLNKNYIH
jgi:hypothetical protein